MSDIPVATTVDVLLYLPTAEFSSAVSIRDTYGLELTSLTIEMPEYKDVYEKLPYSNNVSDLTELGGQLPYDQRKIKADFIFRGTWEEYFAMTESFANFVLGQQLRIVDKSDSAHFYLGRAASFTADHQSYYVVKGSIEWTCSPFRYSVADPTQTSL